MDSYIRALAVDGEGRLFAAAAKQGIFRSCDEGETWHAANDGLSSRYILFMCSCPTDQLFAVTGGGFFWSIDGGTRWDRVAAPHEGRSISDIACNSRGELFYISNSVLFRSPNNGAGWHHLPLVEHILITCIAVDERDYLWAGTWRDGTFVSRDNGESWTALDTGPMVEKIYTMTISRDRYIYAGTFEQGLYRSIHPID